MQLLPLIKLQSAFCAFFLLISTISYSQVQIWGTSQTGGEDGLGSIYSVLENGSEYTLQSPFINSQEGSNPKSSLVVDENGAIYGISSQGGTNNAGTIFRYIENDFEVLYQLDFETDGNNASADLIQIDTETFVGATFNGGENGGGVLFEYSLSSGFNALYHFNTDVSGSNPTGGIVYDDGNLYGSCSNGGEFGFGSIWKYSDSSLSILYNFQGGDPGAYPRSGVTLGSDGSLYGGTQFGGEFNQGTIFTINTDGSGFETIYSLNNASSDGRYPIGKLVESSPGVFLGLCTEGGSSGSGTVFNVTTNGEFTTLIGLQSASDGGFPKAGLSREIDGKFYGVTEFGGSSGFGTVFSIEEDGMYTVVHNFDYTVDGGNAQAALTVYESTLFGCTAAGGANNFGTLFSFDPEDELNKLHDFSLPVNGSSPEGLFEMDNKFYGVTAAGGAFNTGVFYEINLSGERTKLHEFDPQMEGQHPNGSLFWSDENELFYGAARFGGLMDVGSIFSVSETGNLTTIHFFEGEEQGQFPYASPVLHSNGNLYGTTLTGGTFGDGVLYSIDPEGNYEVLFNFFGFFDGASCESQLVETEDGLLYGICAGGGSFNNGSLFQFATETNTLTVVYSFNSATNGAAPKGKLLLHSDGKLYGTTSAGLNGGGSIFRYSTSEGFELLHGFQTASEGSSSNGELVEDEVGNVYGVCSQGGSNGFGTCFKYSEENEFEVIYSFSGAESPNPSGAVALFFPECMGDDVCSSEDPCSVAICDLGVCTEVPINPTFSLLNSGPCQIEDNQFEIELQIDLDIAPAGFLNIGEESIPLIENVNSYTAVLSLEANGEEINLDYLFSETGCEGSTGVIGTAPDPCPGTEVTFIVDVTDLEVDPDGIHLGGNFQNWSPAELPMSNLGDGMWELAVNIGSGIYEYNFFNGNTIFDAEYVIGECASDGKRELVVDGESMTVNACWESCNTDCSLGIAETSLQKSIDLFPNFGCSGFEAQLIIGEPLLSGTFEIIDATGRKVLQGPAYQGRNTISTSPLNTGLFHIVIYQNGEAIAAKRFIVR